MVVFDWRASTGGMEGSFGSFTWASDNLLGSSALTLSRKSATPSGTWMFPDGAMGSFVPGPAARLPEGPVLPVLLAVPEVLVWPEVFA